MALPPLGVPAVLLAAHGRQEGWLIARSPGAVLEAALPVGHWQLQETSAGASGSLGGQGGYLPAPTAGGSPWGPEEGLTLRSALVVQTAWTQPGTRPSWQGAGLSPRQIRHVQDAGSERLQSRRMTPTRKKPGGMRRLRERIILQGIILEHHGHEAAFSSWDAELTGAQPSS